VSLLWLMNLVIIVCIPREHSVNEELNVLTLDGIVPISIYKNIVHIPTTRIKTVFLVNVTKM